jgi:microcompartment protein CcmL/EutN
MVAQPADDAAIALLEVSSIAVGIFLCDVIVKQAPVQLLRAEAVTPGKYLVLFAGDVASTDESYRAALHAGGEDVLDAFFLPYLHAEVLPALSGNPAQHTVDAVGIYEVHTVASGIVAADAALKVANVHLLLFRMAKGIGGKSYFILTGHHADVEAALEAADRHTEAAGTRVRGLLIPNPHEDFLSTLQATELKNQR